MNKSIRLATLAVLAGVSGCGSARTTEPPSVTAVTVSPGAITIAAALYQPLTATATYSDGSDSVVTARAQWSSTAPGVAGVDSGVVTGVAEGTAQISATFGGITGTGQVIVAHDPPPLLGISVAPVSVNVGVRQTQALLLTGNYSGGAAGDLTAQATWLSTTPAVAAVGGGVVSGLDTGSAVITASVGGLATTSQITVTPDNEPVGFTPLTEHYFNTVRNTDGAGIGPWSAGNGVVSIVSHRTAPRSPTSVGQWTYPAGFQAGSSPGMIEFDNLGNSTQLYLSFWMKLSPNFQGQSSGTNKVLFFWINNHPAVFLSNQGSGTTAPLIPTIRYQGDVDSRAYFNQNVGNQQAMTRGQWRRWEVLLIANTPGQANGVIRWWIDGQKVGEYSDVGFRNSAIPFQYLFLQPIWGGTSGAVSATQSLWIDHLYLSAHD